jgi:hypothetical protein
MPRKWKADDEEAEARGGVQRGVAPLMAGFRMGASGNVPFIILELVL